MQARQVSSNTVWVLRSNIVSPALVRPLIGKQLNCHKLRDTLSNFFWAGVFVFTGTIKLTSTRCPAHCKNTKSQKVWGSWEQERSKTQFGVWQGHTAGFRNLRQKMILGARCKLVGSKEASAPLPPPTPPVDTAHISSNAPVDPQPVGERF